MALVAIALRERTWFQMDRGHRVRGRFADIGADGGYNEDHEFNGYRHAHLTRRPSGSGLCRRLATVFAEGARQSRLQCLQLLQVGGGQPAQQD